jgi:hypothetical protein
VLVVVVVDSVRVSIELDEALLEMLFRDESDAECCEEFASVFLLLPLGKAAGGGESFL